MRRGTSVASAERERLVYQALVRAAQRGEKAPTNWQLATLCNCESMATGASLVARLEARGLITVVRPTRSSRVITIVESGLQTAHCDGTLPRRVALRTVTPAQQRSHLRRELAKDTAKRASAGRPDFTFAARQHEARHDKPRKLSATVHDLLPIDRECQVMAMPARPADPRPQAFSRGPCPRCGTRGDLGCAHQQPYTHEDEAA